MGSVMDNGSKALTVTILVGFVVHLGANAFGNDMNPPLLPSAMG